MCGINGVINFSNETKEEALVWQMNKAIGHRGPDAVGVHSLTGSGYAATLGHARLSIIDLSEMASQPMKNEDGTIWLVVHG